MKEQFIYESQTSNLEAGLVSTPLQARLARRVRLTALQQKPYAEGDPIFMQDIAIDTEALVQSGTENKVQEERERIKADAARSRLDALVQEINGRIAKVEKKEFSVGKLQGEYAKLSDAISYAKDVIPKHSRKEAIKPAQKLQRHIRNLLLIKRTEERYDEKVKEAAKLGVELKKPANSTEFFIARWKRRFTGEEWGDAEIREATQKLAEKGETPGDHDDEEVKENAKLSNEERYEKAEEILEEFYKKEGVDKGVKLTPEQRMVLLRAHEWGDGTHGESDEGKIEGTKAGVYNYKISQLSKKADLLVKNKLFTEDEARALIEAGIVGNGEGIGPGPGGEMGDRPSDAPGTHSESEGELLSFENFRATTREQVMAKAAWRNHLGGAVPMDFNERQVIAALIEEGQMPPGYGERAQPAQQRQQSRQSDHGESTQSTGSSRRRERDEGDPGDITPSAEMAEHERFLGQSNVEATREHLMEGYIDMDLYGRKVNSVEVLAYEIMDNEKTPEYQIDAPLGLLKYKRDANGNIETVEVRQKNGEITNEPKVEFQPQNFMHWVRDWMMYWHGESPDQEWNFGQQIGLKRDYNSITLEQMINNPGRYFRSWTKTEEEVVDEHGNKVRDEAGNVKTKMENKVNIDLVNQIKKELWLFGSSRSADIKYRLLMGDDEKLPQTIQELFYLNTFTKTVWDNRSGLYHMMSLPENFKGMEGDVKGDTRLGQALNHAYQVYYHLADRKMLEELLGKDAPLLSGAKILDTLQDMANKQKIKWDARNPKAAGNETFIDPDLIEGIETDPEKVMKFINFFDTQGTPDRVVAAVRRLVRDSINQKLRGEGSKEFDRVNIEYAEQFALSMARWTGAAAKNDVDATGYDAWTRIQVTEEYRRKQLERKRGGAFGNPYTVNDLKQVGVDLFNGIQVQSMAPQGEDGKLRAKSVLEVLDEMQKANTPEDYHRAAAQLVFAENTMRGFANDHMARSFKIFQQAQGSEEINFEKFTHFDYIRGVTFDRAAFEEELKEKFFKPMRYGYSTYPMLDFGKIVRADTEKGKGKFEDIHLGEAMFGREIIEGASWEEEDEHGHGHVLKTFIKPGMEHVSAKDDNWADKIDWNLVSSPDGKIAIWRQVALARLASQLYAHKDYHSTDPAYNWWYYNEIIEALEAIPSEIIGNDTDLKTSKAVGHFFTHHDIEWMRKKSDTEMWTLYRKALISDLFTGSTKGFKEALKKFFEGITKS